MHPVGFLLGLSTPAYPVPGTSCSDTEGPVDTTASLRDWLHAIHTPLTAPVVDLVQARESTTRENLQGIRGSDARLHVCRTTDDRPSDLVIRDHGGTFRNVDRCHSQVHGLDPIRYVTCSIDLCSPDTYLPGEWVGWWGDRHPSSPSRVWTCGNLVIISLILVTIFLVVPMSKGKVASKMK